MKLKKQGWFIIGGLLLLILIIVVSLSSCSNKKDKETTNTPKNNVTEKENNNKEPAFENKLAVACKGENLADCFKKNYKEDETIIYHSGKGASDNSYRYTGGKVNNYVCFGSSEKTCPEGNLYRIIGIFGGNVKLIKADAITEEEMGYESSFKERADKDYYKGTQSRIATYHWGGEKNTNVWSDSTLNKDMLNGKFLESLGDWQEKIATVSYRVTGGLPQDITKVNMAKLYNNEVRNSGSYSSKIGLMYLSDYGFASSEDNWSKTLIEYNIAENRDNNWMHLGASEWTITRRSNALDIYAINTDGGADADGSTSDYAVRPVFYLTNSTKLVSGNGTNTDPFIIE